MGCAAMLCIRIDKTYRWRWGTWEILHLLNERPWAGVRWPTQISFICTEASAERLWSDSAPRLQTDTEAWARLTWEWHRWTEEGENEITGVEWRDGCWGMAQLELHTACMWAELFTLNEMNDWTIITKNPINSAD